MPTVVHKRFGNRSSEESIAAESIANKFRCIDSDGSVLIISNLSLPGGELVKDIDIVVLGFLNDYVIHPYYHPGIPDADILKVVSFCFTIELKRHSYEDVTFTDFGGVKVKYGNSEHDVVDQSRKQRDSLRNVLKRIKNIEPFVTNLIWMEEIDDSFIKIDRTGWNVLFGNFTLNTLFTTASGYNKPNPDRNNSRQNVLYSFKNEYLSKGLSSAFDLFLSSNTIPDSLSRQKFEYITNRRQKVSIEKNGKLNIIQGRAGTGKTIQLIKFAYQEVVENRKRCILLTYNHALVSDIKRIAAFCDFPDGIENAFNVQTIHSYFIQILEMNDIPLQYEGDFEEEYSKKLHLLLQKDTIIGAPQWDYILVDEAQDCTIDEILVWSRIIKQDNIVIADGVDQFVRNINFSSWDNAFGSENVNTFKLYKSLRQKNHIVAFVNSFAEETGLDWHVEENDDLKGGRIIITNRFDQELYKEQSQKLLNSGNSMYDLLLLVDSTLGSERYLTPLLTKWQQFGIKVFNGALDKNKTKYSIIPDESRLFNYNSCRGIEGWCVFCLNLDKLIEEKRQYLPYVPKRVLESDADYSARLEREVFKWVLMPLTRAIDTLVITLYNKESQIANILQSIYKQHKDFVTWDIK